MPPRRIDPVTAVCSAVLSVAALGLSGCAATSANGTDPRLPVVAAPTAPPGPGSTPVTEATSSADQRMAAASPTAAGGLVVTIGDSIMAGLGLDSDQAWPALVARDTGAEIVNLGCSGAGFIIAGDCGDDYAGLVEKAIALNPSVVVIQSSDNDSDGAQDDIEQATHSAIDTLHAALPDARLVGIGTLWHLDWDEPDAIGWASDALQSAVDDDGGVFVSLGQPLRGRPELLQWDGEHPNAQGQIVLSDAVEAAFDDLGIVL
ncbi:SGNH/GDSL hydrolase family protein [Microbacterium sp. VKM Ac-2870]|uniref:SGNH/GDSL hydrolase family protein n=1 Tax=Microbacterium sp. VKM Ac-2870 TaxID=2783825 RepID=UPI002B26B6A3|nr:SGNH/GDSL hydrolase family protein [Microbacterium sp. VKM Ac-2870]